MNRCPAIMVPVFVLAGVAFSDVTAVLQNGLDGYAGCEDTWLFTPHPANTWSKEPRGGTDWLYLEEYQE